MCYIKSEKPQTRLMIFDGKDYIEKTILIIRRNRFEIAY